MISLDLKSQYPIDSVGVNERVAQLMSRSIKGSTKLSGLKLALSMIDLTTLEGKDTADKVKHLCYKAMHPADDIPNIPAMAAVCVYPTHVKTAKKALLGSQVKVASVATAFPSANTHFKIKSEEVRYALNEGADEIDMVISRGEFLSGHYAFVFDEIAAIKALCGKISLKVILETGELGSLENVRKASEIALQAGADFIKTSTGKIQPAATLPVSLVMLDAIKEFYHKTNKMVGMKPAGGISSSKLALQYLVMLHETLGTEWMCADYFRFGASSLANDIILQLGKEQRGVYYNKDHVSID